MSIQPSQPTEDHARDFIGKLADFRNGLADDEKAVMDFVVRRAAASDERGGEGGGERTASREEADAFAARLQQWRDTLPAEDRPLVDELVIDAGVVEPDVEAHRIHWVRFDWRGMESTYDRLCKQGAGPTFSAIEASATGSPFTFYTCWDGRP